MKDAPRARTVLVVEDDPDLLELMGELLRDHGHTVHCASDGGSALVEACGVRPDLILLDLSLPDMSGAEFLARRAQVPHLASLPVVLMSGSDDARLLGALHRLPVLKKPFAASELAQILARAP